RKCGAAQPEQREQPRAAPPPGGDQTQHRERAQDHAECVQRLEMSPRGVNVAQGGQPVVGEPRGGREQAGQVGYPGGVPQRCRRGVPYHAATIRAITADSGLASTEAPSTAPRIAARPIAGLRRSRTAASSVSGRNTVPYAILRWYQAW